jgi:ABC-type transporter Mla subunit MlaD
MAEASPKGGESMPGAHELLPKRLFGYSCSQVDAYIEEWRKQKETELRKLSEKVESCLQANRALLKEMNTLLGDLQSERMAAERLVSELLGLVEKQVRAGEEARKAFEEAAAVRRQRIAALEAKYEALARVTRALGDAVANLGARSPSNSSSDTPREELPCSGERS